jgi:anti-sigma-K factor RskA
MAAMMAGDRDSLHERMTQFVLGEMDDAERIAFERLLAATPALDQEVRELRRALSLLPFAVSETPPPQLRKAILSRVAPSASTSQRAAAWGGWLVAAAAMGAVAILLVQNLRLDRDLALHREASRLLQEPNVTVSVALRGADDTRAAGHVILDLDAKKGAAIIHDLAPLEGDQVYRLWAIVAGKPVWCGDFDPGADSTVRRHFPIPVDAYTAPISRLILTREPGADRAAPVGPTVMTGQVS